MLSEIDAAVETYMQSWRKLQASAQNKSFFASLKPVAVGWKVADSEEYKKLYDACHAQCDKTIETWMNERWIAKLHLKDTTLSEGITILKLMQRRPGSSDALGIDHVDFYNADGQSIEQVLKDEPEIHWTWETNDVVDDYRWISVWFSGTEAKVRNSTVLDTVIEELDQLNNDIKG